MFRIFTYSMFNDYRTEIENICPIPLIIITEFFDFQKKRKGKIAREKIVLYKSR